MMDIVYEPEPTLLKFHQSNKFSGASGDRSEAGNPSAA